MRLGSIGNVPAIVTVMMLSRSSFGQYIYELRHERGWGGEGREDVALIFDTIFAPRPARGAIIAARRRRSRSAR